MGSVKPTKRLEMNMSHLRGRPDAPLQLDTATLAKIVNTALPAAVALLNRLSNIYATSTANGGVDWNLMTLVGLIDDIENTCHMVVQYSPHFVGTAAIFWGLRAIHVLHPAMGSQDHGKPKSCACSSRQDRGIENRDGLNGRRTCTSTSGRRRRTPPWAPLNRARGEDHILAGASADSRLVNVHCRPQAATEPTTMESDGGSRRTGFWGRSGTP
ncbi:hypothetical protein THAOC_18915 [Thalassiosira oceanica]|uniref:Uncharacterized protein n=1 Tax=Thalassiosira oceanica TaxID=159749 RepID=K0SI83_THAOC|nr:hypothetical protein THAOC_18915 [Thalassiosira oceanica]|eukprot:EJK60686.1 hypothetical protein THAOC_18915 [Thalassiosira oceanica]